MNKLIRKFLIRKWKKNNEFLINNIDTRYGKINVLLNDKFITDSFLKGKYWAEYEIKIIEDLLNFKNKKNLIYFDIGANIGSHVLAISKIFNEQIKIYCFEAQSFICKILEANIYENNLKNINIFNKAVSNNNELIKIRIPNYNHLNNFGGLELVKPQYSDNEKIHFSNKFEKIEAITLDNFLKVNVDFIKIDVEGMENLVIEGGLKFIKRNRPFLLVELIKTDTKSILKIFSDMNYKIYSINSENGLFIPNEQDVPIRNLKRLL